MSNKILILLKLIILNLFIVKSGIIQNKFTNVRIHVENGLPAERGRWTFLVTIFYTQPIEVSTFTVPLCTGTLMSQSWVLTAAHCLPPGKDLEDTNIFARMGVYNLHENGLDIPCTDFMAHPLYQYLDEHDIFRRFKYVARHDIGLAKLEYPVLYNEFIQPVVPSEFSVEDGTKCMAQGWGLYYISDVKDLKNVVKHFPLKGTLYEIQQVVISNEVCQNIVQEVRLQHFNETGIMSDPLPDLTDFSVHFFCTEQYLSEIIAPYKGDTGGPLMCHYQQSGIASVVDKYTIWTKLNPYVEWISNIILTSGERPPLWEHTRSNKGKNWINREQNPSKDEGKPLLRDSFSSKISREDPEASVFAERRKEMVDDAPVKKKSRKNANVCVPCNNLVMFILFFISRLIIE